MKFFYKICSRLLTFNKKYDKIENVKVNFNENENNFHKTAKIRLKLAKKMKLMKENFIRAGFARMKRCLYFRRGMRRSVGRPTAVTVTALRKEGWMA